MTLIMTALRPHDSPSQNPGALVASYAPPRSNAGIPDPLTGPQTPWDFHSPWVAFMPSDQYNSLVSANFGSSSYLDQN